MLACSVISIAHAATLIHRARKVMTIKTMMTTSKVAKLFEIISKIYGKQKVEKKLQKKIRKHKTFQ